MIPYNKRQDAQIVKIKDYINGKREYVTGEDTSLTLSNTANSPFNNITLKGNTEQTQYSGKNLFQTLNYSNSNWLGYSINADTKYIIISGSNTKGAMLIEAQNKIYTLKANTTYTLTLFYISGDITRGDLSLIIQDWKNSDYPKFYTPSITSKNKKNVSITFTTDSTERTYNNCGVYLNNLTCSNLVVACQLEINSTATSYEQYVGGMPSPNPDYPQEIKVVTGDNTITISNSDNTEKQELPISLGSLELCKIGDYQDYIYKKDDKWWKHKEISKITNWDTDWYINTDWNKSFPNIMHIQAYVYSKNKITKYDGKTDIITLITTHMPSVLIGNRDYNKEQCFSHYVNGCITFFINKSRLNLKDNSSESDILNAFANYMNNNKVVAYFAANTPTDEQITDTTLINQLNEISQAVSYDGTTNISQTNANLPFIINAEAFKKLL